MAVQIELKPHRVIQPLLDMWRASLSIDREERAQLARQYWNAFVQSILDAKGPPPHSIMVTEENQVTYWCPWPTGGFAQILIKPDVKISLFNYKRPIVVINLNFSPGL